MNDRELADAASQTLIVPMKICKNVIKGLLLFAGALVLGIGFIAAISTFAIGISAIIIGISNIMAGSSSAFLFALGGGLFVIGFTVPIFYVTMNALGKYVSLTRETVHRFREGI